MYIVLVTRGKREGVDGIAVYLFDDEQMAQDYTNLVNELGQKYWIKAQVVEQGKEVEGDELIGYNDNEEDWRKYL